MWNILFPDDGKKYELANLADIIKLIEKFLIDCKAYDAKVKYIDEIHGRIDERNATIMATQNEIKAKKELIEFMTPSNWLTTTGNVERITQLRTEIDDLCVVIIGLRNDIYKIIGGRGLREVMDDNIQLRQTSNRLWSAANEIEALIIKSFVEVSLI